MLSDAFDIGALLSMHGHPLPSPATTNLNAPDTLQMWVFLGSSTHAVKWFVTKELIIGKEHKEESRMTYITTHNSCTAPKW